jgi:hypothetical protein
MCRSMLTCAVICVIVLLTSMNAVSAKTYYVVTHTVEQGETLTSIASKYITPDREIREFREGIVELNYGEVFCGRKPPEVIPGDAIKVSFWK